MGGQHPSEWVDGMNRNQWTACVGMSGRHPLESAPDTSGFPYRHPEISTNPLSTPTHPLFQNGQNAPVWAVSRRDGP